MATQEDMLAELRALNAELGLSENDGIKSTSTYEQSLQELRALDEELASTPESFDEYVARRKQDDSRSLGEKTSAFTDSFITGAGTLAEEGGRAIKQLFAGDVGLKEAKGVLQVGINDFGRFAKTLGGAAMDNFYSDEDEMRREYERYKDNFVYNQNVRAAMLDTFDEKGRDFVSFGANFVDPTMFIPIAGQVSKAASVGLKSARLGKVAKAIEKGGAIASKPSELIAKGTRKALEKTAQAGSKIAGATGKAGEVTSKVAAFPRDMVTKLASKTIDPKVAGSGILGAQVTGAFTGAVPGLGLLTSAEVAGYIANKSGRGMERVLTALGSEAGQKRFLQRLAMQADSPTTRKLALYAHKLGGTRMGDMAFNSLVNGISVSTLNGALAYASTDNIEELGQAMGAGFAMGGALPVGQPGMRAGRSQAARNQSSVNFLEAKLGQDQLKQFRKMDPDARLAFATVEEAGIKAPKLMFVDKNLMLETLRKDDPNTRQAPNAYFDQKDNTIYVNENGRASKSSKEAFDILTHELGHGFITQAIKDDPFFARKILEQYEAKPGEKSFEFAFTEDSAKAPIDSIMLNEDAKKIASAYDSIQEGDKSIGVGQNANLLAQEIGAEQFAMMMVDNPNYFNTIEPSLRQKLLEGSRKVLTLFGAVDGNTGNPLDVSISPILKRNKSIRNLYKNYTKQRDASIADKVDLADKGVAIKVRKGESADQAVDRMYGKVFGAKSFSLDDVSGFRINNKKIKKILTDIKDRLVESPEGSLRVERNQIVGKELNKDLKEALLFGDKLGNKNVLLNAMLEGIKNLTEFNFLYRAGKPSKYSDNELRARIVTPFQIRVTGLSPRSKSAASVKMDAYDLAYLRNNVEVLAREGFTNKPEDLIKEARRVAQQALEDPEGRINPEGNYENELVTAVFGQPESAQFIKNPKLRALLDPEQGPPKLKHSIRSYDVDALAGLVPTGKSGIAFDWFNIKNNYSPFDDKLFIPKPEADVQITDKLFMPAEDVMTAVNVRNELNNKFADLIVSGQKSIETRRSRSLDNLIGNRVKIVRTTGKGDEARVIGEVTIGEPIQYRTRAEFAKDYDKHLVDEDSDFAFQDGGKFGYPMLNPERYNTPYPMPKRKGIVYTKEVGGPDKLFMPASEAGAGKGKQAEAAKLWQEKGVLSKFFKKWFGKSKVVDENGEPLVVYHGTSDYGFNIFDFLKLGERTGAKSAEEGIFFTSSKAVADGYAHLGEGDTFAPMVEQIKKLESQLNDLQKTPLKDITPQLQETYAKLESQKNEIGRELHQARMQRGSIIDSGGLPPKAPGAGVYSTYLSFQNPKIVDLKGKTARALDQAQTFTDIIKEAKANGHDSVIFKNAKDNATSDTVNIESDIFVAFSPEQIKSATGNRGTFDAGERNINYMPSDPKAPKAQPANRIQQQAPAMPGNRFMLPAATAGAKSAERFR
jgi:predicted transcriptional regulator